MRPGAEQRARNLIEFATGLDEGGFPHFARRARVTANDLLDALQALKVERSARVALQARCEQQQAILGKALYQATRHVV